MIDSSKLEHVRNKCGYQNGVCVSSNGNSGGLGLWWKNLRVSLKSFSNKHISVVVEMNEFGNSWMAHGIYGWADRANKFKTWDLMQSLVNGVQIAYIFFGYFNEILCL